MMGKVKAIIVSWCVLCAAGATGQSIHFSQYYNAPMLVNPANTALMPDDDYRIGLNYRNQWAVVPVPYSTFSGFADFKIAGKNDRETKSKWLGVGLAFVNDKAGDGNLSLTQVQGSLAYHLQLSQSTMLSVGVSGAYVQRSVNYDNVTFDAQWDGMTFNPNLANGEKVGVIKTNYYTVAPGLNFAIFPNENLYIKMGGGVANINQPTETFYKNGKNTLSYRPEASVDVLYKTGPVLIVNPSVFFATQSGSTEIVAGSLFRTILGLNDNHMPTQLILGIFDRVGDAVIGVAGMQVGSVQFMASYDFTMSALAPYNASYGALEFSLIYTGRYHNGDGIKKAYNCPRFF
jgi:type IX secretion system PorP/SprF family membrane protein